MNWIRKLCALNSHAVGMWSLFMSTFNSKAPDVPELAHQGIFQLSRVSVNCYVKTMKKYPLPLNLADFLKILSSSQDHCWSHNNFIEKFSKNYTLYGVNISLNFGFRLNRFAFNDTKTHFLSPNFMNLSQNLVISEVCCWTQNSSCYDVTRYKDDFFNKSQNLILNLFQG